MTYFDSKGNEKNMGDIIVYSEDVSRGKTIMQHRIICTLTPATLSFLKDIGAIKVAKVKDKDLNDYFGLICKQHKISPEILKQLFSISPATTLDLCLRAIAVDMDNNYEGDISECETVWAFDRATKEVFELPVKRAKNLRNFAAFRTKEDAQAALKICSPIVKKMYSFGKSKD